MRMIPFLALVFALALSGTDARAEEGPPSDIDKLYARLAHTRLPDEANGIVGEIDALRIQSGSDAADLLMARARKARQASDPALALQLFDALVDLDPEWSEGFGARAALRFDGGDLDGAMADIGQTLKREPRDLGALAGLGAILLGSGEPESALKVYDRALALAPAYEPIQQARGRAQNQVWSRSP